METNDLDGDKSHQSWRWGELPSPPPDSAYNSHKNSIINSTVQSSQNNDS